MSLALLQETYTAPAPRPLPEVTLEFRELLKKSEQRGFALDPREQVRLQELLQELKQANEVVAREKAGRRFHAPRAGA